MYLLPLCSCSGKVAADEIGGSATRAEAVEAAVEEAAVEAGDDDDEDDAESTPFGY